MKKLLAAFALVATAAAAQAAPIISSATPIPDQYVLLNYAGSGLDWTYAGPIAPNEFGPGNIEPSSYRAAEGWRAATAAEWAAHPIWSDFIAAGNPCNIVAAATFNNHSCYVYSSEYWSTFSHVDAQDFANGRVTDGVNGLLSGVPETIYVRDSRNANAVPLPGTLALVGAGFLAMGARRRKAA